MILRCLAGICERDFDCEGRLGVIGREFLRDGSLSSLGGSFAGRVKALVRDSKASRFLRVETSAVNLYDSCWFAGCASIALADSCLKTRNFAAGK